MQPFSMTTEMELRLAYNDTSASSREEKTGGGRFDLYIKNKFMRKFKVLESTEYTSAEHRGRGFQHHAFLVIRAHAACASVTKIKIHTYHVPRVNTPSARNQRFQILESADALLRLESARHVL